MNAPVALRLADRRIALAKAAPVSRLSYLTDTGKLRPSYTIERGQYLQSWGEPQFERIDALTGRVTAYYGTPANSRAYIVGEAITECCDRPIDEPCDCYAPVVAKAVRS